MFLGKDYNLNICLLLTEAGFKNIVYVDFSSGVCIKLQIEQKQRQFESLYMEAQKY